MQSVQPADSENATFWLTIIKLTSMVSFFLMILIVGSLPLRLDAFKSNKRLLSLTSAFSGGLFLTVGLLHLLPEAADDFTKALGVENTFPFAYLITIWSFTLILFIEKIAINQTPEHHLVEDSSLLEQQQAQQVEDVRDLINTHHQVARKASFASNSGVEAISPMTPYILQMAIGIHATFEGISIGILDKVSLCLGIALAVGFHKWAEGLTLGLAFRQAGVDLKTSTYMIMIQAIMNPIGIGIGWALSDAGPLVSGIFVSVSAGTFVYIATVEVIVEEFSVNRYKWQKFMMFNIAILFICSIWFLEKWTEG